jgi:sulfate transport system substrate-binding protein
VIQGVESKLTLLAIPAVAAHAVAAHAAGGLGFRGPQPLALIAANKEPLVLTLASFAVTKLAYVRLTKLFREQYLSEKGIDVRFRLSFAGSGVQV